MRPTLLQQRQQREAQARAQNVTRLLDRAKAVLAQADRDGRDLRAGEKRQVFALCDRADRLQPRG